MILSYFDENKFSEDRPLFYIGGLMVPDAKITQVEDSLSIIVRNFFGISLLTKETEIHGKELWHGKGIFKNRPAKERLKLIGDLLSVITSNRLKVRLICIDVPDHRKRYQYPEPEYALGLMLLLEQFCIELEKAKDIGLVFGDHEEEEYARAITDFSSFKGAGRTPMYRGRSLEPLKDTIYYTRSHHSRFLQLADLIVFLAQRFEREESSPEKWIESHGWNFWQSLRTETDCQVKRWP